MSEYNVSNVTAGKPKTGGAMSVAPIGTALPTDATTALAAAFVGLGYISDEGLTSSTSREVENIKSWGGDSVLSVQTEFEDTVGCTLLETMNPDVLKVVFGDANVSGALATGIAVTANSNELEEHSFVVDMIMRNNALKRVVIPRGKVTEIEEVNYVDNDVVGYGITITAYPDSTGNTHYEYIKAASSSGSGT